MWVEIRDSWGGVFFEVALGGGKNVYGIEVKKVTAFDEEGDLVTVGKL